jgi:hypothetical protein
MRYFQQFSDICQNWSVLQCIYWLKSIKNRYFHKIIFRKMKENLTQIKPTKINRASMEHKGGTGFELPAD